MRGRFPYSPGALDGLIIASESPSQRGKKYKQSKKRMAYSNSYRNEAKAIERSNVKTNTFEKEEHEILAHRGHVKVSWPWAVAEFLDDIQGAGGSEHDGSALAP